MPLAGRDVISSQRTSLQTLFQSTRPARGATALTEEDERKVEISIHAPREGRDIQQIYQGKSFHCISIHAPREGRDEKGTGF